MVDNQTTIFEMLYPTYKITKQIRLIELDNLEMVSLQQNIKHSIETGLKPKLKRDRLGKFCGKEVV